MNFRYLIKYFSFYDDKLIKHLQSMDPSLNKLTETDGLSLFHID